MTLKNDFGKCLLFALSDKENPTVEKALFDWTIVLQYRYWRQSEVSIDLKKVLRAWSFFTRVFANQPKARHICSSVFISISNENRSYPITLLQVASGQAHL